MKFKILFKDFLPNFDKYINIIGIVKIYAQISLHPLIK